MPVPSLQIARLARKFALALWGTAISGLVTWGLREERLQSLGEEIANSVSAGAGLIAAIAGIPLLLAFATQRGSNWTVGGALVFAATTVWLYLASTVYHVLPRNRAKRIFRLFDHMAIFLLIAGTYTPFTLGALRGAVGWTLFAAVWSMAKFSG